MYYCTENNNKRVLGSITLAASSFPGDRQPFPLRLQPVSQEH